MADYEKYLDPSDKGVRVIFGQTQNIIRHSQAAVVNSGTASLETVLLGTPQVVGYISSPITIAIAKLIIKIVAANFRKASGTPHRDGLSDDYFVILIRFFLKSLIPEINGNRLTVDLRTLIRGTYELIYVLHYAALFHSPFHLAITGYGKRAHHRHDAEHDHQFNQCETALHR
jgi:hypothetical protein